MTDAHVALQTEAIPYCPQNDSKGPSPFYLLIDMYLIEVLRIEKTIASVSKRCQVLIKMITASLV